MRVEESVLADLKKKLLKSLFVNGPQPSHADAEAFEKFISAKFVPDQDKNPSVWAWYSLTLPNLSFNIIYTKNKKNLI